MQAQIRLLLKEQSDKGLHCLSFGHPTALKSHIVQLHGPSMLPDKAKFVECSIISLALSFWMKHLVIGQLQKTAKFSAFHWSPS